MNDTDKLIEEFGRLRTEVESQTFFEASILFRELLHEFFVCIKRLRASASDPSGDMKVPTLIARRICELSREIIFSNNRDRLSPNVRAGVSELYKIAVCEMEIAKSRLSLVGVDAYIENVRKRTGDSGGAIKDPWAYYENISA
ncbi:MAG: hypothetical protein JNK57_08500 [Planctomycetaceae bacterium]|nr:hypothetical protein [Planctomycetaceae bacterium]